MATNTDKARTNDPAANPDPITKAPGAHPVGVGVGAAAGGAAAIGTAVAAGAAMGSVVGPVGTAIGAAVGAVAGGLIGKGVAEGVNPSKEHEYWRGNYASRPYAQAGKSYDEYGPAYQYGWEAKQRRPGTSFQAAESELKSGWEKARGKSTLGWDHAKPAAQDAWSRISDDQPGDQRLGTSNNVLASFDRRGSDTFRGDLL